MTATTTETSSDVRRALLTAAMCVPLSLVRSATIVTSIVLGLWATTAGGEVGSDVGAAGRVALLAWLAGFGVHFSVASGSWTLLPVGITVLSVWSAQRAGRRGMRDLGALSRPLVGWFLSAFIAIHVGAITGLSWWVSHEGVAIRSWQAAVAGLVFSSAVAGWLALSREDCGLFTITLPGPVQVSWVIVRRSILVLLGISAGCFIAGLIVARSQIALVTHSYGQGTAVAVGLWALSAVLVPTFIMWLCALIVGAPIDIHSATTLSLFGGEATKLPPLPVMAAIPTHLPGWAPALVLMPIVVFLVFSLQQPRQVSIGAVVGAALLTACLATVAMLAIVYALRGGLPYPMWANLGADWRTAVVVGGQALIGVAAGMWWASRPLMTATT